MEVRLDVYLVIVRDFETGEWRPLGTNATFEGALAVANEATDAVALSLEMGATGRVRDAYQEIIDTMRIVPGVVFIDEDHLLG